MLVSGAGPANAQGFFTPDTCKATFEKNGWTITAWRDHWQADAIREVALPKGLKTLKGKSKMNVIFSFRYDSDDFGDPWLQTVNVIVPQLKRGKETIDWSESQGEAKGFRYTALFGAEVTYDGEYDYLSPYVPIYSGSPDSATFSLLGTVERSEMNRVFSNAEDGGNVRFVIADSETLRESVRGYDRYGANQEDYEKHSMIVVEDLVAATAYVKPDMKAKSAGLTCG
nr:hypothetical protein GCM10011355_20700 [Aquisalinus luteolus]